jgi:hypothetical protein
MCAEFIKNLFTGKDNNTYDISRVILFIGVISLVIFTAIRVCATKEFDPMGFGTGMGGLLGGGGLGIGAKAIMKGEPE